MADKIQAERIAYSEPEQMFLRASIKCPSSVTAQAAHIAYECKEKKLDPYDYLYLLNNNPLALERIMKAAKKAHEHIPKEYRPEITKAKTIEIFDYDFALASEFMVLNQSELQDIYTNMYSKRYKREDRHKDSKQEEGMDFENEIEFKEEVIRKFRLHR